MVCIHEAVLMCGGRCWMSYIKQCKGVVVVDGMLLRGSVGQRSIVCVGFWGKLWGLCNGLKRVSVLCVGAAYVVV